MSSELYTLKEMAEILSSAFPNENTEKCGRKIRHWTLMDLLSPHGKKHTGTGVSREYTFGEILKAAILMELSRWKVPVPLLCENFDMMLDYQGSKEWDMALQGVCNVFLILNWNDDFVNWQMSSGERILGYLEYPEDPHHENYLRIKLTDKLTQESPNSGVILNITRLFLRVQENVG